MATTTIKSDELASKVTEFLNLATEEYTEAMKEAIRYFEEEERKIQNNDMRGFQFSHEKLRDSLNVLFNYLKESIGAV